MITLHGAMPLAFILAEVSLRLDVRGGTHIYVMQAFGPEAGLSHCLDSLDTGSGRQSGFAAPITNYCSEIVGGVGITQTLSIRLGVIIAVAYINLQEIRTSVMVEIGMII